MRFSFCMECGESDDTDNDWEKILLKDVLEEPNIEGTTSYAANVMDILKLPPIYLNNFAIEKDSRVPFRLRNITIAMRTVMGLDDFPFIFDFKKYILRAGRVHPSKSVDKIFPFNCLITVDRVMAMIPFTSGADYRKVTTLNMYSPDKREQFMIDLVTKAFLVICSHLTTWKDPLIPEIVFEALTQFDKGKFFVKRRNIQLNNNNNV